MNTCMRETGVYRQSGENKHFIPHALPPKDPSFRMTTEIMEVYGMACFALGKLNEMCLRLPDAQRFINAYVLKEALLSSEIEGIHTTLIDAFTQPISGSKTNKETQLVLNYTRALEVALQMIKDEGLPLVSRVILNAHETLMRIGEGDKADPGSFRKQSVRVGNLIPPPASEIPDLMKDLEIYMNEPSDIPPLIRGGLVHVQFETIHPFLDGNGRIGRLLIVLMMIESGLLSMPVIYPSYYFKKRHLEYYQRLDRVRTHGDFEGWVLYYLNIIRDSSEDAYVRAKAIEELEKDIRLTLGKDKRFSRIQAPTLLILDKLFTHPIFDIPTLSKVTGKVYNTIDKVIKLFIELGWVSEMGAKQRNKIFRFDPYLSILGKEFEIHKEDSTL